MIDNTDVSEKSFIILMNSLNFNRRSEDLSVLQVYLNSRNNGNKDVYSNGMWDTTIKE